MDQIIIKKIILFQFKGNNAEWGQVVSQQILSLLKWDLMSVYVNGDFSKKSYENTSPSKLLSIILPKIRVLFDLIVYSLLR